MSGGPDHSGNGDDPIAQAIRRNPNILLGTGAALAGPPKAAGRMYLDLVPTPESMEKLKAQLAEIMQALDPIEARIADLEKRAAAIVATFKNAEV
jgi:tetrahydromethanopterin S-methyltransferase subunit B